MVPFLVEENFLANKILQKALHLLFSTYRRKVTDTRNITFNLRQISACSPQILSKPATSYFLVQQGIFSTELATTN